MEGTPPQHPELPSCARTQLWSCPAWSWTLERDGDLSVRAGRDESELQSWPWMPGDFSPLQPLQKQLLVERDGLQLADPLAPGRPLQGGGCCVPYGSYRERQGLEFCSESCSARGGTNNMRFCSG